MNFINGEILLINKPYGWTSFDVVNKIRWHIKRKLGLKKIKVGHAGTLDPLAEGLLILCTGKKTKEIEKIQQESKWYSGKILLGKTTPSFDLETEYSEEFETQHILKEDMERVCKSFIGKQNQIPPLFSAKKIDGKRAYLSARKGQNIELNPQQIEIFDFKINTENFPEIEFKIHCTKGTYIRSIANDFGKKLNSGGTLIQLKRDSSGSFHINKAYQIDEILTLIDELEVG
ncbi:MAG: tRNA pseudouridine(55) synthase TruB [Flavobacteriia bacterium]|nr:tRNA pseudouridine(55) synthase TruB [Flavobacteriia bacterium]